VVEQVTAASSGVVRRLDALQVGEAAWRLGAGRARKEDPVAASAGVVWRVRPGDRVAAGDVVMELHTEDERLVHPARLALEGALEVGDEPPAARPLVLERIG
jgi:thymidine phosphorylase